MKVVMINSVSGYGSTGSICVDIATELVLQGHDCFIAYGQISRGYQNEFKIGTKLENNLHNIGSRLFGKQGYFTKNGTKKLVDFLRSYNPDVIHLHNLHGNYLNLEILFEYLLQVQKPVVWTLHDCWAFTGKCAHYTDVNCYKWQTECNNCPQVRTYPASIFFDRSKLLFKDKKDRTLKLNNLHIITVSKWLEEQVNKSFLNRFQIETIYNWVDHSVFKETIDYDFAGKYAIDTSKFTIVLVSAAWNVSDVKWKDALKLAAVVATDIQILMIGKVELHKQLPSNIKHIPYLEEKEELAKAYSLADVYVHLSTEDSFGKVIAEALSCGLPAVVYNTTACSEIVDEYSGFVVSKRNITEILSAINIIKKNTKAHYSQSCRSRVLKNFDQKKNVQTTIDLYKKL
jgi:glycosyltransferase involved in cell wall biosynthesis